MCSFYYKRRLSHSPRLQMDSYQQKTVHQLLSQRLARCRDQLVASKLHQIPIVGQGTVWGGPVLFRVLPQGTCMQLTICFMSTYNRDLYIIYNILLVWQEPVAGFLLGCHGTPKILTGMPLCATCCMLPMAFHSLRTVGYCVECNRDSFINRSFSW